jgi:hypothetical protein
MAWWWIVPALAGLLAATMVVGGLSALFRRRPYAAIGGVLGGAALLVAALAVVLLALDVQTYERLGDERRVATIDLRKTGENSFDAVLTEPPGAGFQAQEPRVYALRGNEWRIEALVLKWKPWANVLGLDSRYRLDRLSGEFTDTASEANGPRSVYDLRQPTDAGALYRLARRFHRLPIVDTLYGSAALMPMADGARYEIWMSQSGLVARPANAEAARAVGGWLR